jgi:hypothetical protein
VCGRRRTAVGFRRLSGASRGYGGGRGNRGERSAKDPCHHAAQRTETSLTEALANWLKALEDLPAIFSAARESADISIYYGMPDRFVGVPTLIDFPLTNRHKARS